MLSDRSLKQLETCDPAIQNLVQEVDKIISCTVIEGHRNEQDQDKAYFGGKTKVKWPYSKHNSFPSMAVDLAPNPIDWADFKKFYYFAGVVVTVAKSMGLIIRWGGDWDSDGDLKEEKFLDLVHFEIKK